MTTKVWLVLILLAGAEKLTLCRWYVGCFKPSIAGCADRESLSITSLWNALYV